MVNFGPFKLLMPLLAILQTCYGQTDITGECSKYETCDECIAGYHCVWCSDPPPFLGPRCTNKQENTNCSLPEVPVELPPQLSEHLSLEGDIQISPQKLRLYLRRGEPQTFTLSVKPSRNDPLDMYFLMDLSASQTPDLDMLRNLSTSISAELQNISSQFKIGFGSFVDKIAYPYASTLQNGFDYKGTYLASEEDTCASGRDQCEPTYVYRHQLSLNNDSSRFTDVLMNTTIRHNIDSAEGTLEALLQAITCLDEIGWRNGSLRIVLVITDAGFKTALDGKVGALIRPNDGKCHLEWNSEEGFYEYIRHPEQDFPSIYQVRQKLIENEIFTIFAVTSAVLDLYTFLTEELGTLRSFVQEISDDSSDIVEVIRRAYENVVRDVVVEDVSGLTMALTPVFNCNLTANGDGCANVKIEELAEFNVTVTMENCLNKPTSEFLSLPGFGTVALELNPICECKCSSKMIPNHEACNNQGFLVCGTCDCDSSFFGDQCDCPQPLSSCENDCFGRGTCDRCTRECTCNTMMNEMGEIFGSYGERCQCDNTTSGACPKGLNGDICSGRGECICGSQQLCGCTCQCNVAPQSGLSYMERDCSCDPDNCFNEEYPDRLCAHSGDEENNGTCTREGCHCTNGSTSFNKRCLLNSDLCHRFEVCARCGINCTSVENCSPKSLDDSPGDAVQCQFEQSGCTVDFEVDTSGFEASGFVFVGEERACHDQSSSFELGIPLWTLCIILLVGLLLLIVVIFQVVFLRQRFCKAQGDITDRSSTSHVDPTTMLRLHRYHKEYEKDLKTNEISDELKKKNMLFLKKDLEVSNIVGQGESGVVYKGYVKTRMGREIVAVKTGKVLFSKSDVEGLNKEVSMMLSFHHPNVMPLIGVCMDREMPLLIMPFMNNGSVLEYVKNHKKELFMSSEAKEENIQSSKKTLLGMCHQIAKGMAYLAQQKFVHRDLAARNCMIDQEGVIKVADFGLTEDLYALNYFKRCKNETGKEDKVPIRWMAPESIENGIYNESTDVWSFGVTVWEIFTCGRVPYSGIRVMNILPTLCSGDTLEKPRNSACSDEIYDITTSCWNMESRKRPTFIDLEKELSNLLEVYAGYIELSST